MDHYLKSLLCVSVTLPHVALTLHLTKTWTNCWSLVQTIRLVTWTNHLFFRQIVHHLDS